MAQKFKAKTLLSNSGVFNYEVVAPNLVYNTGNQSISGVKSFYSRPFVDGTGISLSGEFYAPSGARIDALSGNLITTGNTLTTNLISTGSRVDALSGNLITTGNTLTTNLISTGSRVDALSGVTVFTTGNQIISGNKTFEDNINISGDLTLNGGLYINDLDELNISGNILISGNQVSTINELISTGSRIDVLSGNLITTGNTLTTNLISTGSRVDVLSGVTVFTTGNQTISGVKIFATGIDIRNSSSPQNLRVFNSTGTTSGEFGLFGWTNNELRIGATQTQNGLLRDVLLTGRNININASGLLNVFDPVNISGNLNVTGNLNISGTGIFSGIDLNNVDNLTLSGVDIIISGSTVNSYNNIFISGNPVLTGVNLSSYATTSQLISTGFRIDSLSGAVVFTTGNQTVSGVKTFTSGINVSGRINNSGMADIFPASEIKRRYPPQGLVTLGTSSNMVSGYFQYFPFLIKKDAVNPKICVEVFATSTTDTPIRYGIYSGNNGFEGARLFVSGSINALNTIGVYTGDINTTLIKGPYIIATSNTGVSVGVPTFRTVSINAFRDHFGDPSGNSTLFGGSFGTTSHYYETGIDLPIVIGSGLVGGVAVAPIPALIY